MAFILQIEDEEKTDLSSVFKDSFLILFELKESEEKSEISGSNPFTALIGVYYFKIKFSFLVFFLDFL